MPSRIMRLVFVLAVLSMVGSFAPGRAIAEPTAEQRAAWVRQIKQALAKRNAERGFKKARAVPGDKIRGGEADRRRSDRTDPRVLRFAHEAGRPPIATPLPESQESAAGMGLVLEAPEKVSLSGAPVDLPGPARDAGAAAGVRQIPSPDGPEDRRDAAARGTLRDASRLSASSGQAFAPNVRVSDPALDNPNRADAQSETAIAAYQNYVVAAWNESRFTGHSPIGFAYSSDGGQTFTAGGYPAEGSNDVLWTSDPVLTVNEKTGEFYLCALVDPIVVTGGNPHGVATLRGTFTGSSFAWEATPRLANSALEASGFIDKPWACVDSLTGFLYVSYTKYGGDKDTIWVQRSTNKGVTWQAPIKLSNASGALVQGSRVAVGPAGEVYVMWKEIGLSSSGEDYFRVRKFIPNGTTWSAAMWTNEVTATTLFDNFLGGAPGFNRELGISFPSLAVDRTTGPRRGRVYVTWNETVNFWDSIPDSVNGINEAEPNDTTFNATPFTFGQTLYGIYNNDVDFDYWRFNAVQGTTYVFWCDESTALYTLRIFCTDGNTRLAFSGDRFGPIPGIGFIVWTAPTTGTYYLRLAVIDASSGQYRVRTAIDTPGGPGQRARDTRDIFVKSSPDGIDWSGSPVRVNIDALGYDNWLPEIAVAGGTLYTAWYDFSGAAPSTCGGEAHVHMARSNDGGATWLQLGPVTDQITAWTFVNSDIIPNQGDYIALFADNAAVYPAWADGRCTGVGCLSTPDVMTAPFLVNGLQVVIGNVVVDTGHVAITWVVSGPTIPSSFTLYRREGAGGFLPVTTLAPNAQNQLFYDDTDVDPSTQYQYRLGVDINGTEVFLGERTVQVPGIPAPALAFEGVRPNPTPGPLTVTFTLPTAATAWLTLFDASGRKLREWEVGSRGPGPHQLDFGSGLSIEPGVYLIRLRQGSAEQTRRVSVIP